MEGSAASSPLNVSRVCPVVAVICFSIVPLGGLLGSGVPAGGQVPASPALTILSRDGRRTLPLNIVNDQELVFLDDLSLAFQVAVREESFGAFTVAYKNKTILLTPDQPLVSIAGRLVSLPAPPTRAGRRWLVPVEFINRALALIYDSPLDLRKASRLLIVGDLRVPRLTVRYENGEPARLIIDATPRASSSVSQENASLSIKFDADALDVVLQGFQPQPAVQGIRVVEPATLAVDLGARFGGFRAATQQLDTATRLTIDLMSAQTDQQPSVSVQAPPPPDLSALGQPVSAIRTIAVDPGHGGEDEGVKGPGGTKEKDLTLVVARRIKAAIESRLGIRVLLTRDEDRTVSLDGRAAVANNNKADMFISLHANASIRKTATGASILYAAFEREAEDPVRAPARPERLPTFGGGLREVDLVPWDLAQTRHLDRSSELATILSEQFGSRVPMSVHPIDRAPLRVLESANMPAVLIEMGYLSNDAQEAQMTGGEFQTTFVQAIYDAVLKFRDLLGAVAQ
jgi:N-acetylmuramoyl-L-alanine amidase